MQENGDFQDKSGAGGIMSVFGTGLFSSRGSRLGNGWAIILIAGAAMADLISLIPLAGDFTGPIFWVLASFLLWKKGCGFLNFGRLSASLISMVAEMIPVIQEFPGTLIGMALVILMVRFEDKTGIKVPIRGRSGALAAGASEAEAFGRTAQPSPSQPLNMNGVRLPSITQDSYEARREIDAKNREETYEKSLIMGATPDQAAAIAEPGIDEFRPEEAGAGSVLGGKTVKPKDTERENERRRRMSGF